MVKQYNVEGYSHLELFDHDATTHVPELLELDATANAPERDLFAEAPEVDQHATATEGVPETGLQVEHSSGDPIPVGDRLEKEVLSLEHGEDPRWLWLGRSRKTWVIACVLMAAIIAIAIGVGVGVGVPNISPEATAPPSSPIVLQHGILADSSLAAVSTATGNLHVFYQDISGALREALYLASTGSWETDVSMIIPNTTDARNNTPLSAVISSGFDGSDEIILFYILANNSLSARWLYEGQWQAPEDTVSMNFEGLQPVSGSRALSVGTIPNTYDGELLLLYEGTEGTVTALHRSKYPPGYRGPIPEKPGSNNALWNWQNISTSLWSSVNSTSLFPVPYSALFSCFLADAISPGSPDGPFIQASLFNPLTHTEVVVAWTNESFVPVMFSTGYSSTVAPTSAGDKAYFRTIDLVEVVNHLSVPMTFNLWVNGTTLSGDPLGPSSPHLSPFPYTRLATTTPPNSSAAYLFHQVNALILAQDIWDASILSWQSRNITIPTS